MLLSSFPEVDIVLGCRHQTLFRRVRGQWVNDSSTAVLQPGHQLTADQWPDVDNSVFRAWYYIVVCEVQAAVYPIFFICVASVPVWGKFMKFIFFIASIKFNEL